ncbi:hypothetical protein EC957_005409 [Mortierella hygrophila]|uniref:C2H2-type domain-containing protein n=1 Tax=Mortierella hygrophila TaxID=979708 RepID=A0A9P6JZX2_9FUNG|nr:hypothetical protein EC957_005409 [Mortierella hygrophila]
MRQPQQQQQYHHSEESFVDQPHHQHQQRRQKQYQLMQQQNQQHYLELLHQRQLPQLRLQHQQQFQHMQQANALVTAGQVKLLGTHARVRTLATPKDWKDIVLEPLAAETPTLVAVSNQRTEGWSVGAQPAQTGSSIAKGVHFRTTVSMTHNQDEHMSATEALPYARIAELGSRSPSLSLEKESERAVASRAAPDLEDQVKETTVSSTPIESSSSSSTAVPLPPYTCPHCAKCYTSFLYLRTHMLTAHSQEGPYACDGKMTNGVKCQSQFLRRSDLVRHIKSKHPNYTNDKDQPQKSTSSSNGDETLSIAVSSRPVKYPCLHCGKYFTRPFNLRSHMLTHTHTHTQEWPFACDGKTVNGAKCKSQFSRRTDLVRHIKSEHSNYTKDKEQLQKSTSSNNSDEMDLASE